MLLNISQILAAAVQYWLDTHWNKTNCNWKCDSLKESKGFYVLAFVIINLGMVGPDNSEHTHLSNLFTLGQIFSWCKLVYFHCLTTEPYNGPTLRQLGSWKLPVFFSLLQKTSTGNNCSVNSSYEIWTD